LFLDEVGEMSPPAQAKFLRVLQEREFQRLGGTRVLRSDARVIAATNRDLQKAIAIGQFREDLLLPPERLRHPAAVPAGTGRGHPSADAGVPDGVRPDVRPPAGWTLA
jgi:transcriptional regulator with GAF, ATPase, and Fis domain